MWPFNKNKIETAALLNTYRLRYSVRVKDKNVGVINGEADVKAVSLIEAEKIVKKTVISKLEISVEI